MEDLINGDQYTLMASYEAMSSDAVTIDGTTYLAFVAEDSSGDRSLVLSFGELGASANSWKEVELDTSIGSDDILKTVSISGDTDRLIISVTATGQTAGQDVVGWTFLGL
jgi:hypothetical protein